MSFALAYFAGAELSQALSVTVLAASFTVSEWGAFSSADLPPLSGMHVVQLFLGLTAVSFLALAAVIVERDAASREARRSEKDLRDVIDTIPMGLGAALPDGSMEFVNRRWADYSGMEDSSGSRWQAGVHPDDLGRHMERSIIEAHRGRLWATPNEPHGAIVQFSLPAA